MNSAFKLIILTLLISNTFFTFFISYDIYNKNIKDEQDKKIAINKASLEYKRKLNTLYYTDFIDSYNFVYAQTNNINSSNILQTNTQILYNISYNCTILANKSSETCDELLKEVDNKKENFIKTIEDVKSAYDKSLGIMAFKNATFDEFSKDIETTVNNIMSEKQYQSNLDQYIQSLNNLKSFLDSEYSKSIEDN